MGPSRSHLTTPFFSFLFFFCHILILFRYLIFIVLILFTADKIGYHDVVFKASSKTVMLPSGLKADSFYTGCDRSKGCFGQPEDCVRNKDCIIAVATSKDYNNQYVFEMIAQNSPAYIAVGLSDDQLMVKFL